MSAGAGAGAVYACTLYGFAALFLAAWAALWLLHAAGHARARLALHRGAGGPARAPDDPLPAVSVLKPLSGAEPNLRANLHSFFAMQYPAYELLFCVEREDDPARPVVEKLIAEHPAVDARLLVGGARLGVNPKINNMQPGYRVAKHDFILISDAGIRMREDTLLDMVQHMRDDIGIVHQMPFTCDSEGFAAVCEKVFFGTVQARMYLCADLLGINCHVGMSSLIRRSALEDAGGLSAFADYLAEDYFMAEALRQNGWRLRVSSQPAWQNSGGVSVRAFQSRLRRWTRLRVAMLPLMVFLEPISECLPLGAASAWAVGLLLDWEPLAFFLVHSLAWFLSDWLMLRSVQNGPPPFTKLEFVLGWLWRQCFGPVLFATALIRPEISWRSRRYKLDWGGKAHELKPKAKF